MKDCKAAEEGEGVRRPAALDKAVRDELNACDDRRDEKEDPDKVERAGDLKKSPLEFLLATMGVYGEAIGLEVAGEGTKVDKEERDSASDEIEPRGRQVGLETLSHSPTKPFGLAGLMSKAKSSIPEDPKVNSLPVLRLSYETMPGFSPSPYGVHSGNGTMCPCTEWGEPIAEEVADGPDAE